MGDIASMSLKSIAAALGGKVLRDAKGPYVLAPGPGHSPKDGSLSVRQTSSAPDGFLTHSFAGDDPLLCRDYVRERCGAEPFKPNGKGKHAPKTSDTERIAAKAAAKARLKEALAAHDAKKKDRRELVATYPYTDEHGVLLYEVLRFEPKDFRQRRPDGNGGWISSLGDVRRVPYHLPELVAFPDATIFLCRRRKRRRQAAVTVIVRNHAFRRHQLVAGDRWIFQRPRRHHPARLRRRRSKKSTRTPPTPCRMSPPPSVSWCCPA